MPFFRRNSQKDVDYKARLEHKLYLAKEDPEPKYDISNCDLKSVPKGVYSVCKVLRKESLLLHHNLLSSLSGGGAIEDLSLLTVLDLSSNQFTTLPNSIESLTNLQELYLSNNLLKLLPESIVHLKNLRILSVPFNRLKKLPNLINQMEFLEELSLQGNPALCSLPNNLCLCPRLTHLVLDISRYVHPPNEVVLDGTTAVLTFLAAQIGVEYKGVTKEESTTKTIRTSSKALDYLSNKDQHLQGKILEFEQKKKDKREESINLEKNIARQKEEEIKMHNIFKDEKDKLMEDLKAQQIKIAKEVMKFQSKKEIERIKLVENLRLIEENANRVIKKMLEVSRSEREPWRVIQLTELDKMLEETLFKQNLRSELSRKEIIDDMESLLKEEGLKVVEYGEARDRIMRDSLSKEAEWGEQAEKLISAKLRERTDVANWIGEDESAQQVAVARLLEKNDLESSRLKAQLKIIEKQLSQLTQLEMKKKKLNVDQLQYEVSEQRNQLSQLLVQVLRQQDERKSQLLNRLKRLEDHRNEDTGRKDYWLVQYQKLLESTAPLDPKLVEQMVLHGVHQHLPVLLVLETETATITSIRETGVRDEEQCQSILQAIRAYHSEKTSPSAPLDDTPGPSAPLIDYETECVVCMNFQCEVIFIPCGHLCSCKDCARQLVLCPLCRSNVDGKVTALPSIHVD